MITKQIISISISLLFFFSYIIFILKKFGTPKSISDTYYLLDKRYRWIFTIVIWGITIPLIVATDQYEYLPYTAAMVSVVAAACNFAAYKYTKIIHFVGAIGGIVAAMILISIELHLTYITILAALLMSIVVLTQKKGILWWIEIIAFLTIISSIIITILN